MLRGFTLLLVAAALSSLPAKALAQAGQEFNGAGAALCVAAGELLASAPGAPVAVDEDVRRWWQVLHVMEGTPEQRVAAVESARSSWARAEQVRAGMGLAGARGMWDAGCSRDTQIRYIAVHGSEQRARRHLADDVETPIGAEAAHRLSVSASCFVAAELFAQPRPSRRLRSALVAAEPSAPDREVLAAIQRRARAEIDSSPGSGVGKEMTVEYLRYLYTTASSGDTPQNFVNGANQTLAERCVASSGGGQ